MCWRGWRWWRSGQAAVLSPKGFSFLPAAEVVGFSFTGLQADHYFVSAFLPTNTFSRRISFQEGAFVPGGVLSTGGACKKQGGDHH